MKILGIDLGSREVKMVVFDNQKIISKSKISTMKFYKEFCTFDGKISVDFQKLKFDTSIDAFISTGYGKNNTNLNDFIAINEIKAHVYGALFQTDIKDFVMLDIGGQDVKIVKVEKGIITDLELNEKCAASCGRFIENMASVLEVDVNELALHYKNPVELNSTCSVFSESELIGKIAEGSSIETLCAGVNYSLYKRLKPFFNKFRSDTLILAGGVANNKSIQRFLQDDYKKVIVLDEAQYNGAIGCCYYGERMNNYE